MKKSNDYKEKLPEAAKLNVDVINIRTHGSFMLLSSDAR